MGSSTKKCPFCSEEILETAIKCKYCGEFLNKEKPSKEKSKKEEKREKKKEKPKKENKILKKIFSFVVSFLLWFFGVILLFGILGSAKDAPVWATIISLILTIGLIIPVSSRFIEKKIKLNIPNKIKGVAVVVAFFIAVLGSSIAENSIVVKVNISEPENNFSIQSDNIDIKGSVEPEDSSIKVNNKNVIVKNGNFTFNVPLPNEKNSIIVVAVKGSKTAKERIVVNRIFTEEERIEYEKRAVKREAEQEELRIKNERKKDKEKAARIALAEERQQKQIEILKNKLQNAVNSVNNFDNSKYRDSVERLTSEVTFFTTKSMLIELNTNHKDSEVKHLTDELERKLIQLQSREFPLMRKNYAKVVDKKMWEFDIDVRTVGSLNGTIEFIGGYFAANRNIAETQTTLSGMLQLLRFDRANYKWYEHASKFDYYDIDSLKDSHVSFL